MGSETKQIIMDVAEALFATHGYEGTSLRMITQQAGVNLAAVNYHFGSKAALMEAIYERRIRPMNAERLRRLDELEARHGDGQRLPLEPLVEAFIAPALRLSREGRGNHFITLLGRSYLESSPTLHAQVRRLFDGVAERFRQAFARALPELPSAELYWRLHFMVGVLAYCMTGTEMMRLIASSRMEASDDPDELITRLVAFISHGLAAPASPVVAVGAAPPRRMGEAVQ